MKLSQNTINILKFYSTINASIKIEPGDELYTKSEVGSMCCYVKLNDDKFPEEFITTDLNKFLATVDLFELSDCEFDFTPEYVTIDSVNGKNRTKFFSSNASLVNQSNKVPTKQKSQAITFSLQSEDLKQIFKAANVLNVSDITITAKDGVITASVSNKSVKTTNTYDIIVGECEPDVNVCFYYKKQHLKLLNEYNYDVIVYSEGVTKFICTNSPFKKFDVYVATTFVSSDDE